MSVSGSSPGSAHPVYGVIGGPENVPLLGVQAIFVREVLNQRARGFGQPPWPFGVQVAFAVDVLVGKSSSGRPSAHGGAGS